MNDRRGQSSDGIVIGFAGLGNMGRAMVRNLADNGFRVIGYDIDEHATAHLVEEGKCAAAEGPKHLIENSDILILMLPNGKIVRDFLMTEDVVGRPRAASLKAGCLVVDMSSSDPLGTRKLGEEIENLGGRFVDAPVSGGVSGAERGTLAIMTGGKEQDIRELESIFSVLGKAVIHVGGQGAGHAMKALNNYVSATGLLAACEALAVARKFGIDGERAIEVLNASTGRNNSTENKLAQFVLSQSYASGFSLGLMHKDLATALELAHGLGVPTQLTQHLVQIWNRAEATIGGNADHTEIIKLLRE